MYDRVSAATAEPSSTSTPSPEPSQAGGGDAGTTPTTETPDKPVGAETSVTGAATTAQPPQAEPNFYETEPDGELPQATLDTLLQTPRGKEIYQGYKAMRELGRPVAEGGIGHVPTLEQTRTYFQTYRDRVLMDGDINSGNPQQIGRFINSYLFDPQRGEGNLAIAANLAPALAGQPEVYAAVMEPFLGHYQEALMERFRETPDSNKELKDALWFAATILNKDLKGEYLKPLSNGTSRIDGQPPVDPLASEREQLAQERQQLEQMRSQSTQAQTRAWQGAYTNTVAGTLMAELDKALAPLQQMHSRSPVMYQAGRRQFHDEVVQAVMQNEPAMEIFGASRAEAMRAGTLQSAQALAKSFVDMAVPVIRAKRKAFLEGAGVGIQARNDATHSELATIDANRTAGNGSGAAPGPSLGPPEKRQAGETQHDYIHRMVAAATRGRAS
jgi:hypothetical protein